MKAYYDVTYRIFRKIGQDLIKPGGRTQVEEPYSKNTESVDKIELITVSIVF